MPKHALRNVMPDLVRFRVDQGVATEREIAQAEALLAQARGTVPPLVSDLEVQLNRLDVLMGDQPGTYAAELRHATAIPSAMASFRALGGGRYST
jgi:outer membrane protein TolC